ncbi:hypothetical protein B296_00055484 [Ensete ventricosum]|uniref:Uncharacterized protein n=1 Tax=Ensete ventricosum TaxID=4639 RepID=A0A426XZC5_ENSVE|nr:hypothetical protein B296_00055484 [Ensete ventricosum]
MLYQVGAAIVCLDHRELKFLWDWLLLDLWDEGRSFGGALPKLLLQPNELLWTSSIRRFISRSCTLSEFVELEERVSYLGMLRMEVLMVGACWPVAFPIGLEGSSGGGHWTSSSARCMTRGCPREGEASYCIGGEV